MLGARMKLCVYFDGNKFEALITRVYAMARVNDIISYSSALSMQYTTLLVWKNCYRI
jgi:hypothetical protein